MTAKFDARELTDAMIHLEQANDASTTPSPNASLSDQEWHRREELNVRMIEARVKLKLMRDRTKALKESLERYRAQRDALRA